MAIEVFMREVVDKPKSNGGDGIVKNAVAGCITAALKSILSST